MEPGTRQGSICPARVSVLNVASSYDFFNLISLSTARRTVMNRMCAHVSLLLVISLLTVLSGLGWSGYVTPPHILILAEHRGRAYKK